jgi:hypothetical protein
MSNTHQTATAEALRSVACPSILLPSLSGPIAPSPAPTPHTPGRNSFQCTCEFGNAAVFLQLSTTLVHGGLMDPLLPLSYVDAARSGKQ